ncbi:hypothetical protein [Neisseria perflava]|uniref:hypothetical protein n=1 Tax=Neisseria perflava TaxID=33053 RepID=UPI0020A167DE|nr:hypothetical protein [Neisseria perflava]MCP1659250.1 hypothetical protein [Neisseria perflava]MCP1773156.1 hypothetical protein [Neisseria perflava]
MAVKIKNSNIRNFNTLVSSPASNQEIDISIVGSEIDNFHTLLDIRDFSHDYSEFCKQIGLNDPIPKDDLVDILTLVHEKNLTVSNVKNSKFAQIKDIVDVIYKITLLLKNCSIEAIKSHISSWF